MLNSMRRLLLIPIALDGMLPVSLCQEYDLDPLAIQVKTILVESLLMLTVLFNG